MIKSPLNMARSLVFIFLAVFITLAFNQAFIGQFYRYSQQSALATLLMTLSIVALNFSLLSLLLYRRGFWLLTGFVLLTCASGSYFIDNYGIVIDKAMLQNVVETDPKEAKGLLSFGLLLQLLLWVVVPLAVLSRIKIDWQPAGWWHKRGLQLVAGLLICIALLFSQFQTVSSFFRTERAAKHTLLPLAPMSASISLTSLWLKKTFPPKFQTLGADAVLQAAGDKPRLVVLVLGETARADHFSLNGYDKLTNPKLASLDIVNFSSVTSCGTATAISLPCMFSSLTQRDYDEVLAKNSDNVLDIAKRAGVNVLWVDNNSGCKEMCNRVSNEFLFEQAQCKTEECSDLLMLPKVRAFLDSASQHPVNLLVLHQMGSHGPEYFKRSLAEQKHFVPECTQSQLNLCSQAEIVNAYDNSIAATDDFLAQTIGILAQDGRFASALWYLSDHGESLGENGIYLHGLPYWMAPDAQKQVPMLMWFNDELALQRECAALRQHDGFSHDYLFHSLLSLLTVQSQVIDHSLNMFAPCHTQQLANS